MGTLKYLQHYTPQSIATNYILPRISNVLYDYVWVDMFCGLGSLIMPIILQIPPNKRVDFFKEHIFMFDIDVYNTNYVIDTLVSVEIPKDVALGNVVCADTLRSFPKILENRRGRIFHVTNPPYLYKGRARKLGDPYIGYFSPQRPYLQDLYQIAMMNDLENGLKKLIYIIPVNFLFGDASSRAFRRVFLKNYHLDHFVVFEDRVFGSTGQNVVLCFFTRKEHPVDEGFVVAGSRVLGGVEEGLVLRLGPENHYRAGLEFDEFVRKHKEPNPLSFSFYLRFSDLERNKGGVRMRFVDASFYDGRGYRVFEYGVSEEFYYLLKYNDVWLRTVDTGGTDGRAGLYFIHDHFNADAIVATKSTTRTQPIQIIFNPPIQNPEQRRNIVNHFNATLEYLRSITNSSFMTTYKYSKTTRKYLSLKQARAILQTIPREFENNKKQSI